VIAEERPVVAGDTLALAEKDAQALHVARREQLLRALVFSEHGLHVGIEA
jgi:hypothetical protein